MRESRYVRLANTHAACFKKYEDTIISMQKEQSHIHSLAAYGMSSDTPVRRKELSAVFGMAS
ncbi:MAG: hypothetical protein WA220_13510 [Candidatus Nitrosopolaris sp.]